MQRSRITLALVGMMMALTLSTATHAAGGFANAAFQQQWNAGEALTPNFWGPLATAKDGVSEPYKEASGGSRFVQYFDKGRMELTNGAVTNGLLATEIVTGRVQTGDSTFENKPQPAIAIAGDAENTAPTYVGLATKGAALLQPTNSVSTGAPVVAIIGTDGAAGATDAAVPDPAMTMGAYDGPTRHNVAQAFVDYRNKAGLPTIGYAISEPFRSTVKVGGTAKDVMVQVFERRALTYTASNPAAFKVEMGNIGLHYFQWRYANGNPPAASTGSGAPPAAQKTIDLTNAVAFRYPPTWNLDTSPITDGPPRVTLVGPTPTLQLNVQVTDQTDPLDTVLAGYAQAAHKLASGGVTTEATADRPLGGEPGKTYSFSGTRADKSPVSGLIAVVFHKGKEYDFFFLADTAILPNMDDVTGILATITFQS